MQIAEPATMITDYMLAVLCLWLGMRLLQQARRQQVLSMRLFGWSFFTTAAAALAGGTSHGFAPMLSEGAHALLWKITVYSIGVTAFLFLCAAAFASLRPVARRALLLLAGLQVAGYAAWMLTHDDFAYVIYDYVPAMLVVLAIQLIDRRRSPESTRWIATGILLSFVGAAIQQSGIGLHRHFNHNDVYHVVQMVAALALYRGGAAMRDRGA